MLKYVLVAADLNRDYARRLVADIPDDKMCVQPTPGVNHAAWVLGHVAFVFDSMIRVFDQKPVMPPEWTDVFNLASKPSGERSHYPSKAELWDAYEKTYLRIVEAVKAAAGGILRAGISQSQIASHAADHWRGDGPHPDLAPGRPFRAIIRLAAHAGLAERVIAFLRAWPGA